jgi:hypothetical protein
VAKSSYRKIKQCRNCRRTLRVPATNVAATHSEAAADLPHSAGPWLPSSSASSPAPLGPAWVSFRTFPERPSNARRSIADALHARAARAPDRPQIRPSSACSQHRAIARMEPDSEPVLERKRAMARIRRHQRGNGPVAATSNRREGRPGSVAMRGQRISKVFEQDKVTFNLLRSGPRLRAKLRNSRLRASYRFPGVPPTAPWPANRPALRRCWTPPPNRLARRGNRHGRASGHC